VNTVLTATRGDSRAKFNIGSVEVALTFAAWLSAHGWLVHIAQTAEMVYLDEMELCWNATLCEQYGAYLERRKVAVS
jgi:hypothetical protein